MVKSIDTINKEKMEYVRSFKKKSGKGNCSAKIKPMTERIAMRLEDRNMLKSNDIIEGKLIASMMGQDRRGEIKLNPNQKGQLKRRLTLLSNNAGTAEELTQMIENNKMRLEDINMLKSNDIEEGILIASMMEQDRQGEIKLTPNQKGQLKRRLTLLSNISNYPRPAELT